MTTKIARGTIAFLEPEGEKCLERTCDSTKGVSNYCGRYSSLIRNSEFYTYFVPSAAPFVGLHASAAGYPQNVSILCSHLSPKVVQLWACKTYYDIKRTRIREPST
jgi:hypothetical protein